MAVHVLAQFLFKKATVVGNIDRFVNNVNPSLLKFKYRNNSYWVEDYSEHHSEER